MFSFVKNSGINISIHESIASLIRDKHTEYKARRPLKYFFLTDLCNPIQAYYSFIGEGIPLSIKSKKEMAYGNKLHKLANFWFRGMEGYLIEEGILDGIFVGIKGVRGKIDALLNNSILEFKTKVDLPEKDPEEIKQKYMQDIEQLVFYSVLYEKPKEVNYLIFISQAHPFKIRSFKVTIKNPHKIRDLIRDRIKKLEKAMVNKDPSMLFRCRYYEQGCPLKDKCVCDQLNISEDDKLLENIKIEYDEQFTKRLEQLKDDAKGLGEDVFTTHDLIFPRKYGIEEDYNRDAEKEKSKSYLSSLVKRTEKLRLLPSDHESIKKELRNNQMVVGHRWVRVPTSIDSSRERIMPYILTLNKFGSSRPHDYHITSLGLICSLYGKTKGVIFEIDPTGEKIKAFTIEYKNPKKILLKIGEIIKNIQEGRREDLPPNPW
ncbi:hypothetical protein ES703_91416 [subsurface metagenome]